MTRSEMPTLDQVRSLALRLPRSARAELIADLVRELVEPMATAPPTLNDEEMREAIQTAVDSYRANPDEVIPHAQLLRELAAIA